MTPSSKNVLIMRTLIALSKRDRKLPTIFYDLGYSQLLIEYKINLSNNQKVVPDLIMSSRQQNHTIVWESKSGRNIENDQAERFTRIQPADFKDKLMLNVSIDGDFTFDIAYACDGAQCQNIRVDLDRLSQEGIAVGEFPVVGFFDDDGIRKDSGSFKEDTIEKLLCSGISVDFNKITPDYYPFDKDSPKYEMAHFVVRSIVGAAARQEASFSSEQIAEDSYGSSWRYLSNKGKNDISSKVEDILDEARRRELRRYLSKIKRGSSIRTLKWQLDYSNRTGRSYPVGRLKTLQTKCREFVNRLRKEETTHVKQLSLPLFLDD